MGKAENVNKKLQWYVTSEWSPVFLEEIDALYQN